MTGIDIAMIDPSLFTGRYDDSLCTALAGLGNRVTLYGRPFRPTDAIVPDAYVYRPVHYRRGEAMAGLASRIVKPIEHLVASVSGRCDPVGHDIAHFQWLPVALLDTLSIKRVGRHMPVVLTVHNSDPFHGDGWRAKIQGIGNDAALAACDAFIVHSEEAKHKLCERGVTDRSIAIIPHPPMRLKSNPAATVRRTTAGRPRIVFMGTIRPYKGVDILLDAAVRLWRNGLDFELAIVGKPYCSIDDAIARARQDGGDRLIYEPGFHTEEHLDAHLGAADIMVFPYRAIDASGALMSVLRYGKPIVASDIAGLRTIDANGDALVYVPPEDPSALADMIQSLVLDPVAREAHGDAVADLALQLGDWDDTAQATLALYAAAIAERKRTGRTN